MKFLEVVETHILCSITLYRDNVEKCGGAREAASKSRAHALSYWIIKATSAQIHVCDHKLMPTPTHALILLCLDNNGMHFNITL